MSAFVLFLVQCCTSAVSALRLPPCHSCYRHQQQCTTAIAIANSLKQNVSSVRRNFHTECPRSVFKNRKPFDIRFWIEYTRIVQYIQFNAPILPSNMIFVSLPVIQIIQIKWQIVSSKYPEMGFNRMNQFSAPSHPMIPSVRSLRSLDSHFFCCWSKCKLWSVCHFKAWWFIAISSIGSIGPNAKKMNK